MRLYILGMVALCAMTPLASGAETRATPDLVVITSPSQAAFDRAPSWRGAAASRQAVRGEGLQAGLRPNPDAPARIADVEVERERTRLNEALSEVHVRRPEVNRLRWRAALPLTQAGAR